jgi:hypothetical protein
LLGWAAAWSTAGVEVRFTAVAEIAIIIIADIATGETCAAEQRANCNFLHSRSHQLNTALEVLFNFWLMPKYVPPIPIPTVTLTVILLLQSCPRFTSRLELA